MSEVIDTIQTGLTLESQPDVPLQVCYGIGDDSTAMLVGLWRRGIRPDVITFGNTGSERISTMAYMPVMNEWLRSVGFPEITVCTYQPKDFKYYPPYGSLYENCLTNGTLPSLAFSGRKNCSLKWKVEPQNSFMESWEPAKACWAAGGRVMKLIGYDATEEYRADKVEAKLQAGTMASLKDDVERYEIRYPLIEWGWTRERCIFEIKEAGLNPPGKSACPFCPATKPDELHDLAAEDLLKIVTMEIRAKPRLNGHKPQAQLDAEWQAVYTLKYLPAHAKWSSTDDPDRPYTEADRKAKRPKRPKQYKEGEGCKGLWNRGCKGTRGGVARPGMMTDYIKKHKLLPAEQIAYLEQHVPLDLAAHLKAFRAELKEKGRAREDVEANTASWTEFLAHLYEESEANEQVSACGGCSLQPAA